MFSLSSLRTTVYHLLPAASNVFYDVSKRPHFYLRPTSCEVKYTGSQILNPFLFCEISKSKHRKKTAINHQKKAVGVLRPHYEEGRLGRTLSNRKNWRKQRQRKTTYNILKNIAKWTGISEVDLIRIAKDREVDGHGRRRLQKREREIFIIVFYFKSLLNVSCVSMF